MTESEFTQLTDCCDQLLMAPDVSPARVAIPWLHVLHGHPVQLEQYEGLFAQGAEEGTRPVLAGLRQWVRELRVQSNSWRNSQPPWRANDELPAATDIVFLTHHVSRDHEGQVEDFYFGEVPLRLAAMGKKVVVVSIDHTGEEASSLCVPEFEGGITQVRLANRLTAAEEQAIRVELHEAAEQLKQPAHQLSEFEQAVRRRAAREALKPGAWDAIRIAQQVGKLVEHLQPRNLVTIHEGYAWERMVFHQARKAKPDIRCLGYHHAVLFPWHHALIRSLTPEFNPDQILVAGDVSQEILAKSRGLRGIPVEVMGVLRATGKCSVSIKAGEPTCVVVPEGIPGECIILFEFALKCARAMPEYRFIFRTHPVLPMASIEGEIKGLANRPPNVELSKRMLGEDFQRSRWALYRGSGAAVQAVLAGLKPFYFSRPGELNFDPLHQVGPWRETVETKDQFAKAAARDLEAEEALRQQNCQQAFNHARRMFQPMDSGCLIRAIESKSETMRKPEVAEKYTRKNFV